MTVYVDRIMQHHNGLWCHMWADTPDELHRIADQIGLKRDWAQEKPGFFIPVHYDLRPSKRALAVKVGAVEVSLGEYRKKFYDNPNS